jgi:hypothetical protein
MTIVKYLRQANFVRKEVYLTHSSGGSRTWHWHWLGSGDDPMADGITMVELCVGERGHSLRQKPESDSDTGLALRKTCSPENLHRVP